MSSQPSVSKSTRQTPDPLVSMMKSFCGTPILWIHPERPASLVTSWNTMGPLSTNPPAVMGRFCSSYWAGAATPPAIPLMPPGCCVACCEAPDGGAADSGFEGGGGGGDCWARKSAGDKIAPANTPDTKAPESNERTPKRGYPPRGSPPRFEVYRIAACSPCYVAWTASN